MTERKEEKKTEVVVEKPKKKAKAPDPIVDDNGIVHQVAVPSEMFDSKKIEDLFEKDKGEWWNN